MPDAPPQLPPTIGTTQQPIGVPTGFKVPQAGMSAEESGATGSAFGPMSPSVPTNQMGYNIGGGDLVGKYHQYMDGDQYGPANDPEAITVYQRLLIESGLLNPKDVRAGVWDQKSADAYKMVLAFANQNGTTADLALGYLLQNPAAGSQKVGAYAHVANEQDIRTGFKNASEALTGGDLPASQEQGYYQYYREQEMKNAAAAHTGGTVVDPMNPASYVQSHDQGQVNAYNAASRGIEFFRMLGAV